MHVKFVSITQPAGEMTAEQLLVYIARVSNPSNQNNHETAEGLLRYMIRNKHWSPFDMVNLCVEVKTSKAISIQILRHWSIKPQEFSQRYAKVEEIEPIELRRKAETNRQSSEEVFDPTLEITLIGTDWKADYLASDVIREYIEYGQELYNKLLDADVAKECARMVLPMATSTVLYLNGSVRSWIHYLQQRTDHHAQKEHREVATAIRGIFGEHFPNILKAIEDNG